MNSEFNLNDTPIDLNGSPGIHNGIKDELTAIIGQPRAFPKRAIVQPTTFIDSTGVRGEGVAGSVIQDDATFAPLYLYK